MFGAVAEAPTVRERSLRKELRRSAVLLPMAASQAQRSRDDRPDDLCYEIGACLQVDTCSAARCGGRLADTLFKRDKSGFTYYKGENKPHATCSHIVP